MGPLPISPLEQVAAASTRDRILIAARRGYENEDMEKTADKVAALLDTTRVLKGERVRHALAGGVAVGIHAGVPRATLDTNVAVLSTCDRQGIIGAMSAGGFRFVGEHPHSLNFRHRSGEPVQLLLDAGFDAMIARAESFAVGAVSVPIVTKQDLIAMKRRAASDRTRRRSKALRDSADLALLLGDVPSPDEGW